MTMTGKLDVPDIYKGLSHTAIPNPVSFRYFKTSPDSLGKLLPARQSGATDRCLRRSL